MGSGLDILPTVATLAGVSVPADRAYDGHDLTPVLRGENKSPRNEMFFYHGTRIFAARKGDFKLYFYENNPDGYPEQMRKLDTLRLFNVQHDPSEKYELANKHPEIIVEIQEMVARHRTTVDSVGSQLEKRIVVK
jgi:arylsulfatase A-like enzyme